MRSLLLSRRDLDFLLHEWLDTDDLVRRERYAEHDRATFDAVLDLAEQVAAESFAPINRLLDEREPAVGPDGRVVQPPELHEALAVFARTGDR